VARLGEPAGATRGTEAAPASCLTAQSTIFSADVDNSSRIVLTDCVEPTNHHEEIDMPTTTANKTAAAINTLGRYIEELDDSSTQVIARRTLDKVIADHKYLTDHTNDVHRFSASLLEKINWGRDTRVDAERIAVASRRVVELQASFDTGLDHLKTILWTAADGDAAKVEVAKMFPY